MVQTIDEIIRELTHDCAQKAGEIFSPSVRAIYGSKDGYRPELIGSCILLEVDNSKYVVTAAHVIDWVETHGLYVAGTVGNEPVQIVGEIHSTDDSREGREKDKYDIAFWEISQDVIDQLGDVKFISESLTSPNKVPSTNRVYTAIGYPISRNKGKVNVSDKKITTVSWKYSGGGIELPDLSKAMKVPESHHIFIKYGKYSSNKYGEKVNSVNPRGISGGALIDLGNFSSPDMYGKDYECSVALSGMVIEKNKKHGVLVSVKIEHIINAIKRKNTL